MTSVATPVRQPFGILNETKIRNLQSIKNRQNATTPNSAPSLKRRAPSPELSDSENVDPSFFDSLNKRKRSAFDDDVSLSKPSRYTLNVVPSNTKPRSWAPTVTPRLETFSKPVLSTPLSAPAATTTAAGRSPTRPKSRIIHSASSRKRFAPPSIGIKSPSLSITAALNGTLAHKKAKRARSTTIEASKPSNWFFDIFEESEEQQDYRMCEWTMTQSSAALDISDDEGKAQEQLEKADRGKENKENIDPNNDNLSMPRSMARAPATVVTTTLDAKGKHPMISDEPRSPLGDLNPAAFYAAGLDATSVILVHEDSPEREGEGEAESSSHAIPDHTQPTPPPLDVQDFTFAVAEDAAPSEIPAWALGTSSTSTSFSSLSTDSSASVHDPILETESADIEIWESESAKDENEDGNAESLPALGENSAFSLQEL